jgi:transcriptional regulator with XRE-family HTH domain
MTPTALKEWRDAHGWSQKKCARYLGTSQVNVSRWEKGTHDIPDTVMHLVLLLANPRNLATIENSLFTPLDR